VTCRELADFLLDYVEGDLDPEIRRSFDRHLSLCPNCVNYVRAYGATASLSRRALRDLDADPASRAVEAGVPEDLVRAILAARGGGETTR
jgi:anti-sigma factor RsiW